MKDVQIVRLSTGEEVVAEVKYDKGFYTLSDAILLVPAGEGKIGFMPFMAYTKAKDGITIDKRFVVFIVEPATELADQVRQMDTGLTVPKNKIIT